MAYPSPPMPWQELKRLEECCEVTLRSYLDEQKRLCWRMTVLPRASSALLPIRAEAPEIQDAVRSGVQQAIKAGLIPATPPA